MDKENCVPILIRSCTGKHYMVELTQKEYDQLVQSVNNFLPHYDLPEVSEDIEFRYKDFPNET